MRALEIMDYIPIFVILGVGLFFTLLASQWQDKEIKRISSEAVKKLATQHSGLFSGSYSYFTNNHPYVWGEVDHDELMGLIEMSATGIRRIPVDPPNFCSRVDEERKRFYFVYHKRDFDFSTLMHYQEWLDSQSKVAENIERYKNT